jgi:hypothetical protein
VALPSRPDIEIYAAPFAPEPKLPLDGLLGHGIVGSTDSVRATTQPGYTLSYQWYAGHYSAAAGHFVGEPIPGATSRAIKLTEAQLGAEMRVYVYAHGVGAAPSFTFCDFSDPVLGPMLPRTPVISGRAAVGSIVKAKVGSWGPHTRVRFSYQWFAGNKEIRGATRASLRIGRTAAGKKLRLRVTGKQYLTRQSALSRYTKKVKR